MAVASFVHTNRAQQEALTEDSKTNNNLSFDEASIFLAGASARNLVASPKSHSGGPMKPGPGTTWIFEPSVPASSVGRISPTAQHEQQSTIQDS